MGCYSKPTPKIEDLIGKTFAKVTGEPGNDELKFIMEDGTGYQFHYHPDCCASCDIEDIIGDLSDLEGSPILSAEEVSSEDTPGKVHEGTIYTGKPYSYTDESFTWTFYKFATAKGYVTVRWYGKSNGYYSESVDFCTL
jgi:hypothetical protein